MTDNGAEIYEFTRGNVFLLQLALSVLFSLLASEEGITHDIYTRASLPAPVTADVRVHADISKKISAG